jgi:hypothetical protein
MIHLVAGVGHDTGPGANDLRYRGAELTDLLAALKKAVGEMCRLVELLGRYSNWTSWTDRLPAPDKTGELSRESRSRARRTAPTVRR